MSHQRGSRRTPSAIVALRHPGRLLNRRAAADALSDARPAPNRSRRRRLRSSASCPPGTKGSTGEMYAHAGRHRPRAGQPRRIHRSARVIRRADGCQRPGMADRHHRARSPLPAPAAGGDAGRWADPRAARRGCASSSTDRRVRLVDLARDLVLVADATGWQRAAGARPPCSRSSAPAGACGFSRQEPKRGQIVSQDGTVFAGPARTVPASIRRNGWRARPSAMRPLPRARTSPKASRTDSAVETSSAAQDSSSAPMRCWPAARASR